MTARAVTDAAARLDLDVEVLVVAHGEAADAG